MLSWAMLALLCLAGLYVIARPDRFRFRGSVLLAFCLLTLGMTSPLLLYPSRMMLAAGGGQDAFIGTWNLWWSRCALAMGLNPLETAWLYHPHGTSLALHTFSLTYGIASLPVQWFLSPGAANLSAPSATAATPHSLFVVYNLILLVSFTLSGYFTYRLAWEVSRHRTGSLLAGIMFGFCNFRFANTVRLHVITTELLVLCVWTWVVLLRRPSGRQLLLWAGSMVLLLYNSLEYTVYALLQLIILTCASIPELRLHGLSGGLRKRRTWLWIGGTAAGVALASWPLLAQLSRRLAEGRTAFDPRLTAFFSADVVDFFLPNPRHPIWGALCAPVTAGFHKGDGGFGLSLGWVVIGLGILSAVVLTRAREARRWLWCFVILWVLSLGPVLHVAGAVFSGIPLPQALVTRILPALGGSRTPIRLMAPAWLALAVCIACGWAALRRRHGLADLPRPARVEIVLIGLLLFESLAAPLPMLNVPVPEVYRQVTAAAGTSALVHVPGAAAREDLLYQTVHRQRLMENLDSAMPLRSHRGPDAFDAPQWGLLTRDLGSPGWVSSLPADRRSALISSLRDWLKQNGVRWVVLTGSREALTADGRSVVAEPVLSPAAYVAFREHLRLLGPVREVEIEGRTLFDFGGGTTNGDR